MNINVILAKKNLCSETPKHIFEKKCDIREKDILWIK